MGEIVQQVREVQRQQESGAVAIVRDNRERLSAMMPGHIQSDQWVRRSANALRTGKPAGHGLFELEVAAQNNPDALMRALTEAAGLGLQPGTPEYWLTPRRVNGRVEILGIIGYVGLMELMFRAGAVTAVITDVVRKNDEFIFQRGRDEYPTHIFDWRASEEERGEIELSYAYAKYVTGFFSTTIVLNQDDINRIKSKNPGSKTDYSPWATDPAAMWKKSAIRRLANFVPTSAEYKTTQLRQEHEALRTAGAQQVGALPTHVPAGQELTPGRAQLQPGENVVEEGDLMEDEAVQDVSDLPEAEPEEPAVQPTGQAVERMNPNQQRTMISLFNEKGIKSNEGREQIVRGILKIEGVFTPGDMTTDQAKEVIAALRALQVKEGVPETPADPEDAAVDRLAEEAERESAS